MKIVIISNLHLNFMPGEKCKFVTNKEFNPFKTNGFFCEILLQLSQDSLLYILRGHRLQFKKMYFFL